MESRQLALKQFRDPFDILIVGGGINGAVCAACLSAYGYKVVLIDQNDFASKTSQMSSNLIWGGIKYLENLELSLVFKLCRSRNKLMRAYPSLVKEIRFLVPYLKKRWNFKRSLNLLYGGTWLYWLIGLGFTRIPQRFSRLKFLRTLAGKFPLKNDLFDGALEYSDAYLPENDARFVYRFILQAQENGATVLNYVRLLDKGVSKTGDDFYWVEDLETQAKISIKTKWLINATGPWMNRINRKLRLNTTYQHFFSKGIHLIFNRIFKEEKIISFFDEENRLFFALPMDQRTVIGTTDTRVTRPEPKVTQADRAFILRNINRFLDADHQLSEKDIISERCGVRSLAVPTRSRNASKTSSANWFQLSRKHVIESDLDSRVVHIFGGKITDCLNIGEEVYHRIHPHLNKKKINQKTWYGEPGDLEKRSYERLCHEVIRKKGVKQKNFVQLDKVKSVWWRRYGNHAQEIVKMLESVDSFDEVIAGSGYYEVELEYIVRTERVVYLEDLLRRRTKLSQTQVRKDLLAHPFLKKLKKKHRLHEKKTLHPNP